MPRLAIVNMLIGFITLTLAAAAGAFIAFDTTQAFLHDKTLLDSWSLTLQRSAHGHTNLFALLHIVFGLTLPYSSWTQRAKRWQTIGLSLGTLAMGPLMMLRSCLKPSAQVDSVEILMGALLSTALLAIFAHAAGLAKKLLR